MPVANNVFEEVILALNGVKAMEGVALNSLEIMELSGGQHNDLYRVRSDSTDLAIRISKNPNKQKKFFAEELHNHRCAAKLGLGEPIVHFNLNNGLLVYDYIEGTKITDKDMRKPKMLGEVFGFLKKLHDAPIKFKHNHSHIARLRRRTKNTIKHMPEGQRSDSIKLLVQGAERAMELLEHHSVEPCPVHGDLILNNILKTKDGLIFIDWQLSGMGDPHEEVANLLDGCNASVLQGKKAIESYFGGVNDYAMARIMLHWFLISMYWVLRHEGEVQKSIDVLKNIEKQKNRMKEANTLLASEEYTHSLNYLSTH